MIRVTVDRRQRRKTGGTLKVTSCRIATDWLIIMMNMLAKIFSKIKMPPDLMRELALRHQERHGDAETTKQNPLRGKPDRPWLGHLDPIPFDRFL